MNTNEQMIREQAYVLWDHAGRPDGRSDEFWFAAKAEFEREEETGEKTSARMFPLTRIRLVVELKRKRGLTQLGGPDELACDSSGMVCVTMLALGFNLLLPLGNGLETVCVLIGVASAIGLVDDA